MGNMENKVIAYCNGGLGNRFAGLIGGMALAERIGRDYIICWNPNNRCGCSFKDLFNTDKEVIEKTTKELSEEYDCFSISHTKLDQGHLKVDANPNSIPIIDFRLLTDKTIVYTHNIIPGIFVKEIVKRLKLLKINKENVLNKVKEYCAINKIDKTVSGIHLRRTDYPKLKQGYSDEGLYEYLRNRNTDCFFICSDDKDTELKFKNLHNVIIRDKPVYVKKMVAGSWRQSIIGSEGIESQFNINRTREATIEGFIDILILSRTTIQTTASNSYMAITINGISTFLSAAQWFGQIPMEELCL